MMVTSYKKRCHLPVSPEAAFNGHDRPGAFERLIPPWDTVEIGTPLPELCAGARTLYPIRGSQNSRTRTNVKVLEYKLTS
jgi:hypothetical protein